MATCFNRNDKSLLEAALHSSSGDIGKTGISGREKTPHNNGVADGSNSVQHKVTLSKSLADGRSTSTVCKHIKRSQGKNHNVGDNAHLITREGRQRRQAASERQCTASLSLSLSLPVSPFFSSFFKHSCAVQLTWASWATVGKQSRLSRGGKRNGGETKGCDGTRARFSPRSGRGGRLGVKAQQRVRERQTCPPQIEGAIPRANWPGA